MITPVEMLILQTAAQRTGGVSLKTIQNAVDPRPMAGYSKEVKNTCESLLNREFIKRYINGMWVTTALGIQMIKSAKKAGIEPQKVRDESPEETRSARCSRTSSVSSFTGVNPSSSAADMKSHNEPSKLVPKAPTVPEKSSKKDHRQSILEYLSDHYAASAKKLSKAVGLEGVDLRVLLQKMVDEKLLVRQSNLQYRLYKSAGQRASAATKNDCTAGTAPKITGESIFVNSPSPTPANQILQKDSKQPPKISEFPDERDVFMKQRMRLIMLQTFSEVFQKTVSNILSEIESEWRDYESRQ